MPRTQRQRNLGQDKPSRQRVAHTRDRTPEKRAQQAPCGCHPAIPKISRGWQPRREMERLARPPFRGGLPHHRYRQRPLDGAPRCPTPRRPLQGLAIGPKKKRPSRRSPRIGRAAPHTGRPTHARPLTPSQHAADAPRPRPARLEAARQAPRPHAVRRLRARAALAPPRRPPSRTSAAP